MTARARYREHESALHFDPLEAATALARAITDADVMIYEQPDAWCIAIGSAATVSVTADGLHLRDSTGVHTRPLGSAEAMLNGARELLYGVPIEGWRAYGFASFELAQIDADGVPASPLGDWPYLHLNIPRIEVRFAKETALIRALAEHDLRDISARLAVAPAWRSGDGFLDVDVRSHEAERYRRIVARAVSAIHAGAFSKVILSRIIPIHHRVDMYASFVAGRRGNQPARSFFQRRGGQIIAGFSPETVVEVARDGRVSTQPLAGTRSRSGDPRADEQRRLELCSDLKEVAEHALSVKLAIEELQKVCRNGSVCVEEFMAVAARGSVQHLASRVAGHLASGRHAFDALAALFPAITASGIPKQPALRFIREHELGPRGPYSGAMMIADQDGSLDAALVLRSLYQRGEQTWLQAGAGIVAQSTPERELEETCEKLHSVSRRLVPFAEASPLLHAGTTA